MIDLRERINKTVCQGAIWALFFMTVALCLAVPSVSDDFTDRRITTGAKVFRALLAADMNISQKTTSDGKLRLCLLYINNADNAERAAETLLNRADSRIRKLDVSIEILPYAECVDDKGARFAGVFLTQTLTDEKLKTLIKYSNEQNMVVFSPLEGDVERGVQSGIAVEARVRPYLNIKALRSADVRLKSFFMKVAKQYEE